MADIKETDVLVAGAGPAGAIAARLLARHGRQVTLVDPGSCATDRLEVLPPSGCLVLQALDLVDILHDPQVVRPCLGIRRRWGAMAPEFDDFLRRPGSAGYVVDRARFDVRLRAAASEAGVRIMRGRVVAAQCEGERIRASIRTCAGDLILAAGVAVDATGRPAVLARRLGARRRVMERLVAVRSENSHANNADDEPTWLEVESLGPNWSYRVSGPDGRLETWSVRRGEDRSRRSVGRSINASSVRLSPAAGVRWIAVGDAAMSFDPITSQGLVSAFTTALAAGDTVMSSRGLDAETADAFSQSVTATAQNSERGRREVYQALTVGQNGA
ncbi:FAD-dependent oxidoreductase [Bradyrhizobium sp. CSA112]|uniref:NAD(P)/FAD-dependent oxidoreductase n=1 Tax=Bradyrhizobium sp. CSA112 TaxID=2699170 RepID=UPI0023B12502|nr:FAD-dependent monooxygenase [Bradyrhizobium sp. CSA112]MDE5454889.1 FAD-dependent oxidoreductase [Bradyrhizobium sp. CSA112]